MTWWSDPTENYEVITYAHINLIMLYECNFLQNKTSRRGSIQLRLRYTFGDGDIHDDVIKQTFSALLAIWAGNSPVTDKFPAQRPVTRSFDVFFDLRLNKRLSKQS